MTYMFAVMVPAGRYVVAVSGGVDSMVLLDVLAKNPELELVVAHYEHGIRADSDLDRQLVQTVAKRYDLPFIYEHGNLGAHASEATAREARYAFLRRVMAEQHADAIITAHHQDDVLETIILNIMRGTGRKGLSSLESRGDIVRPLLHVPKSDIREYVRSYPDIIWREDSTNTDDRYLRNYIRKHIMPRLTAEARLQMLSHAAQTAQINPVIDDTIATVIRNHSQNKALDRRWFITLPYDVSCEVMTVWLRMQAIREFDRRLIGDLVIAAKTGRAGKRWDINAEYWLETGMATLTLSGRPPRKKS